MSKSASLHLHSSRSLIERVISFLDFTARTAALNNDPVTFGL